MSAENILQTVVGKVGEFYEWLADRLNDDAARAEVLIDLGLPPNISVGQPFPQHQIKGINEYRKTISIETEVSAGHAQDLGKVLGLSSSKAAKLVLPEKNLANIRAYRDAKDPSFDDFKKALGDIKEVFTTLTNFVKALDVEGIHNIPELVHRLIDILMVDYLRLHFVPRPLIYWSAPTTGFLQRTLLPRFPCGVESSSTIFRKRGWQLDDEEQARTLSDNVFIRSQPCSSFWSFWGRRPPPRARTTAIFQRWPSSRSTAGNRRPVPPRRSSTRCLSARSRSASTGRSAIPQTPRKPSTRMARSRCCSYRRFTAVLA
jgi:hypothetical protein